METIINVSEETLQHRAEMKRLSTDLATANAALTVLLTESEGKPGREDYFRCNCKVMDLRTELIKVRTKFTDSILADLDAQEGLQI